MDVDKYYLYPPTEISVAQLYIPQDYNQQCIDEIYRLGDSMNQKTNVKASMSSPFIWNKTKVLNPLIDIIIKTLNEIIPIPSEEYKYKLTNCWGAIYKKGDYTIPHTHAIAQISFIYYLKSNPNSSPLLFNDCNFHIQPHSNKLILFPGYLRHSVPKQIDSEDRICLAGNFIWEPK
jgi:hypothetical protein